MRYTNFKDLVKFNSDQFRFYCTVRYIFKVVSIIDLRFDTNHNVEEITATFNLLFRIHCFVRQLFLTSTLIFLVFYTITYVLLLRMNETLASDI